ncbi:MAG: cation diffusion facilitator family transporter, partial [Candidatus Omnitrophica bacterium]|nr:cation diffusion facilitator family transporter [Candidatus Omnitrophota bacterium]
MNAYRNSTVHDDQRLRTAQKVTMTGLLANLLLTIFKYLAGVLGRSYAMVADATHSLSDIITDVIVLLGVNMASKPVDEDHAYGHGKIETLSAVLVAVSLALVGAGIVWSSLVELIRAL